MERTHAWAVVGEDGEIKRTKVGVLAVYDSQAAAKYYYRQECGERVVRVVIEADE